MATVEECEEALQGLAGMLAKNSTAGSKLAFDRTLNCTIRDLKVIYVGHLHDGQLTDIRQTNKADAQVRLDLTSDDLVAMVAGKLNLASAWASGRIKVHAGVLDMIKLRGLF